MLSTTREAFIFLLVITVKSITQTVAGSVCLGRTTKLAWTGWPVVWVLFSAPWEMMWFNWTSFKWFHGFHVSSVQSTIFCFADVVSTNVNLVLILLVPSTIPAPYIHDHLLRRRFLSVQTDLLGVLISILGRFYFCFRSFSITSSWTFASNR